MESECIRKQGGGAASPFLPLLSFPSVSHFSRRFVQLFRELNKGEERAGKRKRRARKTRKTGWLRCF